MEKSCCLAKLFMRLVPLSFRFGIAPNVPEGQNSLSFNTHEIFFFLCPSRPLRLKGFLVVAPLGCAAPRVLTSNNNFRTPIPSKPIGDFPVVFYVENRKIGVFSRLNAS